MKKNTILSIMTCAAMLLLTAACSNDENSNGQEKPIQAVQFSFTNEDFGADETLSRATSAAETKPQTVDLGDCEAEISVENEPAVKTRGTMTNANGHYTIRAYQGGMLKGEMKGTFSGGNFTPDASSSKKLNLPYGTYDFIAFNDQVSISGTELKVDRTDAETARMGFATVNINSDAPLQVLFTMKHVGARVRVQLLCQKHYPENITATLEATSSHDLPIEMTYNPVTQTSTFVNGAVAPYQFLFKKWGGTPYSGSNYGKNYNYYAKCYNNPYSYYLPCTDASKLRLTFTSGTVFWKPLTGGIIPKLSTVLPDMQSGKSYLITIKLKPNYTYLMSDGTTGHFKDTTFGGGSKTPVGVVADPTARVAIALKNAGSENKYEWYTSYPHADNTTVSSSLETAKTDMEGYKWTWETAGSTDGTIKANQQNYPAFYAAGHYDPGVTVSGTLVGKKWYLAGGGEWRTYIYKDLGFTNDTYVFYGLMVDEAFTKVGGTKLTSSTSYLMSTQILSGTLACVWGTKYSYDGSGSDGYGSSASGLVRPFIKY